MYGKEMEWTKKKCKLICDDSQDVDGTELLTVKSNPHQRLSVAEVLRYLLLVITILP